VETRATPEAEGVRASVRALLGEQRFDEAWALLRPLVTGDGERGVWDLARTVLGKLRSAELSMVHPGGSAEPVRFVHR